MKVLNRFWIFGIGTLVWIVMSSSAAFSETTVRKSISSDISQRTVEHWLNNSLNDWPSKDIRRIRSTAFILGRDPFEYNMWASANSLTLGACSALRDHESTVAEILVEKRGFQQKRDACTTFNGESCNRWDEDISRLEFDFQREQKREEFLSRNHVLAIFDAEITIGELARLYGPSTTQDSTSGSISIIGRMPITNGVRRAIYSQFGLEISRVPSNRITTLVQDVDSNSPSSLEALYFGSPDQLSLQVSGDAEALCGYVFRGEPVLSTRYEADVGSHSNIIQEYYVGSLENISSIEGVSARARLSILNALQPIFSDDASVFLDLDLLRFIGKCDQCNFDSEGVRHAAGRLVDLREYLGQEVDLTTNNWITEQVNLLDIEQTYECDVVCVLKPWKITIMAGSSQLIITPVNKDSNGTLRVSIEVDGTTFW